jgi:two-component system phosphate regulon sensor histidine kinase PhoR
MFRRLFSAFGLLTLTLFSVLGLAVALGVSDPEVRVRVLLLLVPTAALGLTAVLVLTIRFSHRFGQPLRDLAEVADQMAAGEGTKRVFAPDHDEVGRLAQAFNRLGDRLATRISQLEEDRQQLRTILSGMVEGVVALDAEGRVLFANDRAHQLLDFPTTNPVGRRLWEVVRQRPLLDVVQQALSGPQPHREELTWAGATLRSLTVHAARLPGPPPRGAVLVVHDTTELRRLERLRQEFVANVSHELKTPLSVIKVCVETLLDGAAAEAGPRAQFLEQIANHSERLHALILDLISLARIESGEELLDFMALPVAQTLRTALARHRPRAEARGQSLCLLGEGSRWVPGDPEPPEIDPDEQVAAWADEEAVGQILDNLLDNAVKYTPDGGKIEVAWRATPAEVILEVRDNGIGIPEPDLPRIFERFYRVDKARSRELGGTGLGLSIVKHLTQALHGTVRATSRLGSGTTFTVTLPRATLSGASHAVG